MIDKNIPANIISKFEKEQFKPGDAVCFTWFGVKRYGYVKAFKEVNWGVQYTIQLDKMSYPCGIQVGEYKTKYRTGLVQYDETKKLTNGELIELANNSKAMYETVSATFDRPEEPMAEGIGESDARTSSKKGSTKKKRTNSKRDVASNKPEVSNNKVRSGSNQDDVELGDDGMYPSDKPIRTKKSRKPSIEIQQNILSNFFKNIE